MRATRLLPILPVVLTLPLGVGAQELAEAPSVILDGVPFRVGVAARLEAVQVEVRDARGALLGTGTAQPLDTAFVEDLAVTDRGQLPLEVRFGSETHEVAPTFMAGWLSLLPPLLAIVLAWSSGRW